MAAAAAVVLRAFHERPNFYSATVYLGQSTACRMILLNMLLLTLGTSVYGLQRLLYGPLRAIEIEQLWDKAWYAITETALAMTTFRDQVGGYFFLMFMTLLGGRVWGWIGEGRVETLEQQPPANPKTFYARLTTSLVLSVVFDVLMAQYCLGTILEQRPPRAGMMIMFVFEFVILTINSISTLARFGLAGYEKYVAHKQTQAKIEERRQEIRAERASSSGDSETSPEESIEIDENEIDVPGWQEKGKWVLFLDLTTDFLKLFFYMGFFMVLIIFAGIPIHMFRDLFITTRSFLKRINDYLKYRNATRDMNSRYPDATTEELQRDGICIICREEMRPWQPPVPDNRVDANQDRQRSPDERQRPKKLPCGHILHFGCLRSWLERQQVCPTCRRSVLVDDPARQPNTNANHQQPQARGDQPQPNQAPGAPAQQGQQGQQPPPNQQGQGQGRPPGINRMRTFNLGSLRLTLATGQGANVRDVLNQMQNQANQRDGQGRAGPAPQTGSNQVQRPATNQPAVFNELHTIEQRILQEANSLNLAQQELHLIRAMQGELNRLRSLHGPGRQQQPLANLVNSGNVNLSAAQQHAMQQQLQLQQAIAAQAPNNLPQIGVQQVFSSQNQSGSLSAGDAGLPEGMVIPDGWTLLPLQRMGLNSQDSGLEDVLEQAPLPGSSSQTTRETSTTPNASSTTTNAIQNLANGTGAGSEIIHPSNAVNGETRQVSLVNGSEINSASNTSNVHNTSQAHTQQEETPSSPPPSIPQWSTFGSAQQQSNAQSTSNAAPPPSSLSGSGQINGASAPDIEDSSLSEPSKSRTTTVEDATEEDER